MEGYIPVLLPFETCALIEHRTPTEWKEITHYLTAKIGRDPASVVSTFLRTPLQILYEKNVPHCSLM